jgi:hypothetical protein
MMMTNDPRLNMPPGTTAAAAMAAMQGGGNTPFLQSASSIAPSPIGRSNSISIAPLGSAANPIGRKSVFQPPPPIGSPIPIPAPVSSPAAGMVAAAAAPSPISTSTSSNNSNGVPDFLSGGITPNSPPPIPQKTRPNGAGDPPSLI